MLQAYLWPLNMFLLAPGCLIYGCHIGYCKQQGQGHPELISLKKVTILRCVADLSVIDGLQNILHFGHMASSPFSKWLPKMGPFATQLGILGFQLNFQASFMWLC